ncbi:MAG TPA: DUF222 domain-containing protein [Aquihabitans sp.]|jgi:hypothetical protein|nr:DUF222 domain-containing protein [Aquihabitans sp.]
MPLTRAAFEAGELSVDHVDVLCSANRPPLEALFARDEALLVSYAKELGYDDFQRVVRHWENCGDDATADERAERGHAERYLRSAKTMDGDIDLQGRLDPIAGGIFTTELERLERELFEADWAAHEPSTAMPCSCTTSPAPPPGATLTPSSRWPSAPPPCPPTPSRVGSC